MATPKVLRATEAWAVTYARTWQASVFSSFLSPALFLAAMGLGLGSLVDGGGTGREDLGGVSYVAFLAPGLLAAAAMQTAAAEATYPVMVGIKWARTYHTMLATPLGAADVALGHLVWIVARVVLTSVAFAIVATGFGVASAGIVAAVPAAVLTGAAFAGPIAAFTASLRTEYGLAALLRFGIVPMFLFSGTFFPVDQLPAALRPVAYATPLWHGVELCRSLALGRATAAGALTHVAYLALWTAAGAVAAVACFRRKLVA